MAARFSQQGGLACMKHPPIDSQITFLYTDDLAQMAQFYGDVIGLSLKLDQGTCRIYQVAADSYFGFCQRSASTPPSQQQQSQVILTIVTHNVDKWHQYLAEHDIRPDNPPTISSEYGIYHFFVRDPDGHLLEVQQFLDPF
jgi:catechol 2,3-dioxygenase-like lactoylglutathione lyase family enzyme